ncbi:hypothetical cytosolic protein [Syntrophus aciditrophicus SB]|uniref:Hypothetical cytosolic protein n=1 Tax=Syntrophus aciditrophicus (strain SB) TaxID=56780 RepID=Q2LRV9_SYNAS|nr:hypothetical cytosolic protein [Syntrophus aciditrophicus SB]
MPLGLTSSFIFKYKHTLFCFYRRKFHFKEFSQQRRFIKVCKNNPEIVRIFRALTQSMGGA